MLIFILIYKIEYESGKKKEFIVFLGFLLILIYLAV